MFRMGHHETGDTFNVFALGKSNLLHQKGEIFSRGMFECAFGVPANFDE
jgi:hypothetical protein